MPRKPKTLDGKLKNLTSQFKKHESAGKTRIRKFRSSSQWRGMSELILSKNPLCSDPFGEHEKEGRVELAKQVHHIRSVATNWELRLSRDNLASICFECHGKINFLERQNKPTIHLFDK